MMAYSSLSGQVNKWTRVAIVPGLAYQSLGCPDVLYFGSSNPLMHFANIRFYVFSEKVLLKEHLRRFKIINSETNLSTLNGIFLITFLLDEKKSMQ